jgi:hypothetical protein
MNMLSLSLIFLSEAIDHYELILIKNNKNLFSIYFQFIFNLFYLLKPSIKKVIQ